MPLVDWCQFMSGSKQGNGMAKLILNSFKTAMPEVCQTCPYSGLYQKFNAKFSRKMFSIFPSGRYRLTFEFFINKKLVAPPAFEIEVFD
jgi:hypothetical protein